VIFAVLALFLGVIGIYSVISELASRRVIRIALGTRPPQVLGMIIGQGLKLALIGILAGIFFSLRTSRLLASELYRVSSYDPATFITVPRVFVAVALLASYISARRTAKLDSTVALRQEKAARFFARPLS
jgi:putative ABC transport system permease protein